MSRSLQLSLDSWPALTALVLLAVLLVALAWLGVARPWRSGPGMVDRVRIGTALVRYDLWLELRGVGRRRRRDLREELRANLQDAAAVVGTRPAIAALGPAREMSRPAAAELGHPRWTTGLVVAAATFLAVGVGELVVTVAWLEAARASGAPSVSGALPFFPGSLAEWERTGAAVSMALSPGWLLFAATGVAFVLAARPWLVLRGRPSVGPA